MHEEPAAGRWQPIGTAPKTEDDETGVPPLVLLGCFRRGVLIWAIAARWGCVSYGYVQCASRSGWTVDYSPQTARGADRPRPSGEWLLFDSEFAPTHWAELVDELPD